jgi:hypothetical protein
LFPEFSWTMMQPVAPYQLGAVTTTRNQFRRKFSGNLNRGKVRRQPSVVAARELPHMVVRVETQ